MNENNVGGNIENEKKEAESPVYSSRFLMNRDLFYDFNSVSYNKVKKIFIAFFCFIAVETAACIASGNQDNAIFGIVISLILLATYLWVKKAVKINYERMIISAGKESITQYELFEDKIVAHVDELKREYSYYQITKFFETDNFILLHMQPDLFITLEKSSLNADAEEVKSFLMNKCLLVKKKKFINCSKDKMRALVFLIASFVVSVAGTAFAIILNIKNNF